jgi:multiple RNA-binding domain-containing protein 1
MMPEHAVVAFNELNGTMFHGRMFHLMPGKANDKGNDDDAGTNFKKKKQQELRKTAGLSHNWNTLFLGTNAVADAMAKAYGKSKEEVLDSTTGGSNAAVRLALGETQIVLEMKKFLEDNGVHLEAFDDETTKRSKTTILAKNLPAGTEVEELTERFSQFGVIEKILLPPSGVTCLIKFEQPTEARKAFRKLAYSKFKHLPLFLEWAPDNVFQQKEEDDEEPAKAVKAEEVEEKTEKVSGAVELPEDDDDDEEEDSPPEPNTTLFIKNLNHLGAIHVIQIAMRRNPDNPQKQTPLGYGFIQFKMTSVAEKALKTMQFCVIDDKKIELKRSDRTVKGQETSEKKQSKKKDQNTSTKIMVRNIPFQANLSEIKDLFKTFGELKAVRLPKKMASDQHRGFGFVDFVSKSDAKHAFEALHHSTHLYGRRLVLEWAEADQDVEEIRKRTAEHVDLEGGKAKKRRKALLKIEDGGEEEME